MPIIAAGIVETERAIIPLNRPNAERAGASASARAPIVRGTPVTFLKRAEERRLAAARKAKPVPAKPLLMGGGRLGLTERQQECLDAIARFILERGMSPTYEELMVKLGYASKSAIQRLVSALAARGHITYEPKLARAIALTGCSTCPHCGGTL